MKNDRQDKKRHKAANREFHAARQLRDQLLHEAWFEAVWQVKGKTRSTLPMALLRFKREAPVDAYATFGGAP